MIFVVVLIIFFLLIISEKVFERTNYYKKNYCETEKLKHDEKVDFINTGSTLAYYGIDYKAAGVKGLNLALCPQSLESDFTMLKHYENLYNNKTTVFIVISDLAFAKKCYFDSKNAEKYYRILDNKEIKSYNPLRAIRAKYLPVLYNWKNFLRFHWDIKQCDEYELMVNENDIEAVEADAYSRCKAWIKEFDLTDLHDASQGKMFTDVFEYTTSIVSEMVNWCRRRGLNPVLVNLPITSEMKKCFSQDFLDAFYYNNVEKVVKEQKVKFIDLQNKAKLSDYLLYLDSCRLNKPGREIITKLLLSECAKV